MQYVGLHSQIVRNNIKSVILLLMFPTIIFAIIYFFLYVNSAPPENPYGEYDGWKALAKLLEIAPWVLLIIGFWFLIAYFSNVAMIRRATKARTIKREENPKLYNIVENLCMSCGMGMPKINIVNDNQLNAFASGISADSYTVTVTTGLLRTLNDKELAGVIGHELTHIRNHDILLLIISTFFVGIFSTIAIVILHYIQFKVLRDVIFTSSRKKGNDDAAVMLFLFFVMIISSIAYFFCSLTRFALSRKREYLADAGGAELCGDPLALASALRKISHNTGLQEVGRDDIAQFYIVKPKNTKKGCMNFLYNLFSTHPSIEKRIAYLEQF